MYMKRTKKLVALLFCIVVFSFVLPFASLATEINDSENSTGEINGFVEETSVSADEYFLDYDIESTRGKVIKIVDEDVEYIEAMGNSKITTQYIKVKVERGRFEGETVLVENIIDETYLYNIKVSEGQMVTIDLEMTKEGEFIKGYITEIVRDKYIYYMIGAFVIVLVSIGGMKGFKTLLTLSFTVLCIFKLFLPRVLAGENPIILSIGISVLVTLVTIFVVSGFNKKSLAAIIGTIGGVLIAGMITLLVGVAGNLTGLGNDEAQMLMVIPQATKFNFQGLLFAGIILGALGAVMDVCMSISSSMTEIREADSSISYLRLFKSAMNVGKDMMGTMSNTLILAYTGSSMYMMLLFMAHDIPWESIANKDLIVSEVLRALAGSIGLILSIPVTALAFIGMHKRAEQKIIAENKVGGIGDEATD